MEENITMKKPQKPPLKLVANQPAPPVNRLQPPPNLRASGANCWKRVMAEYDVQDSGGLELLQQLCASLDDIASYDAIIDAEGVMIRAKIGTKAHPLLKERLSARAFVARTIQRLGLNIEVVRPTSGRPPGQSYPPWED
jgi:hypothetical protein